MNLPNKLTITRALMVPVILIFMLPLPDFAFLQGWNAFVLESGQIVAFFLFALASYTDYLDGKIARDRKLVTNFGKFLDPIADKVLVVSVLIAYVQLGRLPAIVPIIIIIREFIVTGVRLMASEQGVVIAASNLGKAKTVTQIVALLLYLGEGLFKTLTNGLFPGIWITWVGDIAMFVSVILALVSGIDYLKKNISFLKE